MATRNHDLEPLTVQSLLEDWHLKKLPTTGLYLDDQFKVKKEDVTNSPQVNFGSAFLGPNLWDQSLENSDFNLEYMSLDEFLSYQSIPTDGDEEIKELLSSEDNTSHSSNVNTSMPAFSSQCPDSPHPCVKSCPYSCPEQYPTCTVHPKSQTPSPTVSPFRIDFQVTEHDLAVSSLPGEDSFDPQKRRFTEKELELKPITTKMRKVITPNDMKDEKYWTRRLKNNTAAKRSRDMRRTKENQIVLRTAFLEKENLCLREEMTRLWKENARLKEIVAQYESPSLADTEKAITMILTQK